jgi:hypothetical protein
MVGWYYTLAFVFSILVTASLLVKFIFNLISDTPNRVELVEYEKILYAVTMSYIVTYLIYI